MNLLCKLGRHAWTFTEALIGQSSTTLRCTRCAATKVVAVDNS